MNMQLFFLVVLFFSIVSPVAAQHKDSESEEYRFVKELEEQFDAKAWERSMHHKQKMQRLTKMPDRGLIALRSKRVETPGVFVSHRNGNVSVRPWSGPSIPASIGLVGAFAEVVSADRTVDGALMLPFERNKLGAVGRGTLRLFRWDPQDNQFTQIHDSLVSDEGDYVGGSITRPGYYALIGLNQHPEVQKALQLLTSSLVNDPIIRRQPSEVGADVPGSICALCEWFNDGKIHAPDLGLGLYVGSYCNNWTNVGPSTLSGHIEQIFIDPMNSNRMYAAARDGGVWTLDSIADYPQNIWRPLTDDLESLKMRAMAVAASNSKVLYAANGLGYLYRSDDRGTTWSRTSDTRLGWVLRIIVHPREPMTVLVGSTRWDTEPVEWQGLRVSFDGGETWRKLHDGKIVDVAMDSRDASILYIAESQVGVHKSYSLGFGNWRTILPWSRAQNPSDRPSSVDRIRIALGHANVDGTLESDADRTVAVKFGREIWVSPDGGNIPANWKYGGTPVRDTQLDHNTVVAVHPANPSVIFAGGVKLHRSQDGGSTWQRIPTPHDDHQSITFDHDDPRNVFVATDGGIFRSFDGGRTWFSPDSQEDKTAAWAEGVSRGYILNKGLATMQFYRAAVQPDSALGIAYHWGIVGAPTGDSHVWEWAEGGSWEFRNVVADPKRSDRYYVLASKLKVRIYPPNKPRYFATYGDFATIGAEGQGGVVGALAVDPSSETILVGAKKGGRNFVMITQQGDVLPVLDSNGDWDGLPDWHVAFEASDQINAVALAPSDAGRAYAMTQQGVLYRTDDVNDPSSFNTTNGNWWRAGAWNARWIRQLAVNSADENVIYAITSSKVGRSDDGGTTWIEPDGIADAGVGPTLPAGITLNSIVAHPSEPDTVILAANNGVYISKNRGNSWYPFDATLPNAEVRNIALRGNHLYAITYGRGVWRRCVY